MNQTDATSTIEYSTSSAIRYRVLGMTGTGPHPVVLSLAADRETSLTNPYFGQAPRALLEQGIISASLDLPCHGDNLIAGELEELEGWGFRTAKQGPRFFSEWVSHARQVIDDMVDRQIADPARIGIIGTSRGGFAGCQLMAIEPRIQCAALIAPVVDLAALSEFAPIAESLAVRQLALSQQFHRLAGRPIWMCIGNDDKRVDTTRVIEFAGGLVTASWSANKRPRIEFLLTGIDGHTAHPGGYDAAASWVVEQLNQSPPPVSNK